MLMKIQTFIHPSAVVEEGAQIGEGVRVGTRPGAVVQRERHPTRCETVLQNRNGRHLRISRRRRDAARDTGGDEAGDSLERR